MKKRLLALLLLLCMTLTLLPTTVSAASSTQTDNRGISFTLSADGYFCGSYEGGKHTGTVIGINISNIDSSGWDTDRSVTVAFTVYFRCNVSNCVRNAQASFTHTFTDSSSCHKPFSDTFEAKKIYGSRNDAITFTLTTPSGVAYKVHHEKQAADCTESGISQECWECRGCGKVFSDANFTQEIAGGLSAVTLPALGHRMSFVEAVAATCTAEGNRAYWHCARCSRNYSEEAGTNELSSVTTAKDASNHTQPLQYTSLGEYSHRKSYPCCGRPVGDEAHDFQGENGCTLCGQPTAAAVWSQPDGGWNHTEFYGSVGQARSALHNDDTAYQITLYQDYTDSYGLVFHKTCNVVLSSGVTVYALRPGAGGNITVINHGKIENLKGYENCLTLRPGSGTYDLIESGDEGGVGGFLYVSPGGVFACYVTADGKWIRPSEATARSIQNVRVSYPPITYVELTGSGVRNVTSDDSPIDKAAYALEVKQGETVTVRGAVYQAAGGPSGATLTKWYYEGKEDEPLLETSSWNAALTLENLQPGTYTLICDSISEYNYTVTAKLTLTVTQTNYTVTFDPDGGTVDPTSKTVEIGAAYGALPTPTRAGYDFDGWYLGDEKVTETTTMDTAADHTLTARWTPGTHTFYNTFYYLETLEQSGEYFTVAAIGNYGTTGDRVTAPLTSYKGFTFDAEKSTPSGVITGDGKLVLRLYYTRNSYTVTFDPDGGTVDPTSKTVRYGDAYGALPTPTRDLYDFDGWYLGDEKVTETTRMDTAADHTLTARWSHTHIYNCEVVTPDALKTPADCTHDAVYYASCACGAIGTSATFPASGTALNHDWGAWRANGDDTHTRICKRDDTHTETAPCTGGTATCTARAVCDTCGAAYGTLAPHPYSPDWSSDERAHWHACTACDATADEAPHSDADSDHACDTCGRTLSVCADNDRDHLCDLCGKRLTECADTDRDHLCDLCGKRLTECADNDRDHLCDLCGKKLTDCADNDRDHLCDLCGKRLTECADDDRDHLCDLCGKRLTECADNDRDHLCDLCGKRLTDCADNDRDHLCDLCGKRLTECADNDRDHLCDLCGKRLTDCADNDRDHLCDTCGKQLTDHTGGTATCTARPVCTVCGAAYGATNPDAHTGTEAWTITEDGHTRAWDCCGKVSVPTAAHTYGDWTLTTPPTATEAGERTRACTLCAHTQRQEVPPTGRKPLPFEDVGADDWFCDDVRYVYENGLMNGTEETSFSPYLSTTRGMIVTVLYRMEGAPDTTAACPFADVPAGTYYEKAIAWAAANGIVNGYSATTFGPEDPITREQMAAILYRYANYKGIDVSAAADLSAYGDASSVSAYARPAMGWVCGAGIVQGSDGLLLPTAHATRAQIAAILHRYCEKLA